MRTSVRARKSADSSPPRRRLSSSSSWLPLLGAQHRDGSVWYFGERVDDYEGGKIVVPAEPHVGQAFAQERAPGVAEDGAKVVAVGREETTPAGKFSDCVKTRNFAPLDKVTEFKYGCRGVGIAREDQEGGRIELVRYR